MTRELKTYAHVSAHSTGGPWLTITVIQIEWLLGVWLLVSTGGGFPG